jgi:predicted nucleotidyltransferase
MIKKIIESIKETLENIHKSNFTGLILYGSYAKNKQTKNSDIDLIITFKKLPKSRYEKSAFTLDVTDPLEEKYKIPINCNIIEENQFGKSFLALEIYDYAKIIVDKNNKIKKNFDEIKSLYAKSKIKKIQRLNHHLIQIENV